MKLYAPPGVVLLVLAASVNGYAQGSLTPPAPPAPSMKTLAQVEPRTDLATVPGDADYHHIISQPGSYYLSGNLAVSKAHGIDVRVADVTIDLNGFAITRGSGSGGRAIEIDPAAQHCVVKNGAIRGFVNAVGAVSVSGAAVGGSLEKLAVSECAGAALYVGERWRISDSTAQGNSGSGINAGGKATILRCVATDNVVDGIRAGEGSTIAECTVSKSKSFGIHAGKGSTVRSSTSSYNTDLNTTAIFVGEGSTLEGCTASHNTGSHAILAESGSTVTGCTATRNTVTYAILAAGSAVTKCVASGNFADYGIKAGGGTISDSTASNNIGSGLASFGIHGEAATIINCTALRNENTSNVRGPNTGTGIFATRSLVKNCTTNQNQGDGIRVQQESQVIANTAIGNGFFGSGAGIHTAAGSNRIESNDATENDRGIHIEGTGNLVVKNSTGGNTVNYEIVLGNRYGPIVDISSQATVPVSGSSAAGNTSTTDPWANFAY